ncbi:hypothetical protein DES52_11316 [Deinococcus yavapaiensis KR-236]|uniref:Curli production assembly/transport component CsgG n=2 Tax=Deinococcus TaxID=1298 RepID=A0A318S4R1_9DEIO|nr:hypothetical protein DES52_11316 [Deinococcus yavapaiensis KR-236]
MRDPIPAFTGTARSMIVLDMESANDSASRVFQQAALGNEAFRSRFKVIDRETLKVLLNDQKLAAVGLLNAASVAALGKQTGASLILKSNLNLLDARSNSGGSAKYGYYTYYTSQAEVSVSVVDVETGEVVVTATGRGSGYDSKSSGDALRMQAFREAAESAIDNLVRAYVKRVS